MVVTSTSVPRSRCGRKRRKLHEPTTSHSLFGGVPEALQVRLGKRILLQVFFKYILRPPVATERVQRPQRRLKRTFGDGTFAVEMDELPLAARLAAMVPPPWQNQVRYAGVLAPAAKWRSRIVATAPGHEAQIGGR